MTEPLLDLELPGLPPPRRGKVRNVFDLGDQLLFVASDRLSAFDCILPTGIPDKGRILTQLSAWWFRRLGHVCPNHVIETDVARFPAALQAHREILRGRSMLVRKTQVIPVECVARGYLIGGGWKDYQATGAVSGIPLRAGYRQADRLDEPIFTPAHKAESGHDENISFAGVVERVGQARAEQLRTLTLTLYREAAAYALTRGIIIADTKFEFGRTATGEILLIDEVLTPDSSRFWPADDYVTGRGQASYDKQPLRDYLEGERSAGRWNGDAPPPPLPDEVIAATSARYLDAFRRITGESLDLGSLT